MNVRPVLDLARRDRGRPARPTRGDARTGHPARQPLRLPRLPPRLPHLRPRPHHPLHPDGRRWTTRPDHPRTSHPCAGATTGSRPTPPGTTNASTTTNQGIYSGPHPPVTSTRSPRSHGAHHHEEPDAPPPRPTPAGATRHAHGPIEWFRQLNPAVVRASAHLHGARAPRLTARSARCSRPTASRARNRAPNPASPTWSRLTDSLALAARPPGRHCARLGRDT